MPKVTKATLIGSIVRNAGVRPCKAKEALETVLQSIKEALKQGRKVDMGRLGILSVMDRPVIHRIAKNLKGRGPDIDRLHKRHPKTVRLTKRQDLSENPQPTVVHRIAKPQVEIPARRRLQVAVAFPRWRRR